MTIDEGTDAEEPLTNGSRCSLGSRCVASRVARSARTPNVEVPERGIDQNKLELSTERSGVGSELCSQVFA